MRKTFCDERKWDRHRTLRGLKTAAPWLQTGQEGRTQSERLQGGRLPERRRRTHLRHRRNGGSPRPLRRPDTRRRAVPKQTFREDDRGRAGILSQCRQNRHRHRPQPRRRPRKSTIASNPRCTTAHENNDHHHWDKCQNHNGSLPCTCCTSVDV